MEFLLDENKNFKLENVKEIKELTVNLFDYDKIDSDLSGHIDFHLSYQDLNLCQNLKKLSIPFSIILDKNINLLNLELVEFFYDFKDFNLNISYRLKLEYETINLENEVTENQETSDINNTINQNKEEKIINEKMKEEIKNDYDLKLKEELNRDSVITTTKSSEREFLKLFESFEEKHLKIKKIKVYEESDFIHLSKELNFPIEYLKENYDESLKIITLKSYE